MLRDELRDDTDNYFSHTEERTILFELVAKIRHTKLKNFPAPNFEEGAFLRTWTRREDIMQHLTKNDHEQILLKLNTTTLSFNENSTGSESNATYTGHDLLPANPDPLVLAGWPRIRDRVFYKNRWTE